jgi:hypothetical protein
MLGLRTESLVNTQPSFFLTGGFLYLCAMPIHITSIEFPLDNSGRIKVYEDPDVIMEALREQDSDDDLFTDSDGNTYYLDDLIGHELLVGDTQFVLEPR